jgi:hypothetical protein
MNTWCRIESWASNKLTLEQFQVSRLQIINSIGTDMISTILIDCRAWTWQRTRMLDIRSACTNCKSLQAYHSLRNHILMYPVNIFCDTSVDTWVSRLTTLVTKGHDSNLYPTVFNFQHQWTSRVTLRTHINFKHQEISEIWVLLLSPVHGNVRMQVRCL